MLAIRKEQRELLDRSRRGEKFPQPIRQLLRRERGFLRLREQQVAVLQSSVKKAGGDLVDSARRGEAANAPLESTVNAPGLARPGGAVALPAALQMRREQIATMHRATAEKTRDLNRSPNLPTKEQS